MLEGALEETDRARAGVPFARRRPSTYQPASAAIEQPLGAEVASAFETLTGGSAHLAYVTLCAAVVHVATVTARVPEVVVGVTPSPPSDAPPAPVPMVVRVERHLDHRALLATCRRELAAVGAALPAPAEDDAPPFDLLVARAPVSFETVRHDVQVSLEGAGPDRRLVARYRRAVHEPASIRRYLATLARALDCAARQVTVPLERLCLLTEPDLRAVEAFEGAAPTEAPDDLFGRVESVLAAAPDRVVLVHEDWQMTAGVLLGQVRSLAEVLVAHGVGREARVGLSAPRSIDAVVASLAIVAVGATYVPLDPALPAARLAKMVRGSGVQLVVTPSGAASVGGAPALAWRAGAEGGRAGAGTRPVPTAGQAVYVLHTSGSTGEPKGVVLPHGTASNLVAWQVATSRAPAGRTLQFAPMGFDVSFQEIWSALAGGGCLVLCAEDARRDVRELAALVERHRIERVFMPYVALRRWVAEVAQPAALAVREVISAGEQLRTGEDLQRFARARHGLTLRNQYGPTETHVVTEHVLDDYPMRWPETPPVGTPIPGAVVRLLSDALVRVPLGALGDLYVSGPLCARGYAGAPRETASRFVPDPHATVLGTRMYRTGDLGSWSPDGAIAFGGRADNQLKIRGYRVEPGEIERLLEGRPEVRTAVVVGRDHAGEKLLVAYVVPDDRSAAPDADELRAYLAERLPDYAVPGRIHVARELPLTRTGKVDRAALSAGWGAATDPRPGQSPPAEGLERDVAALWERALGVPVTDRSADFFALGGHSLLATQMLAGLQAGLGVELRLRLLFENPRLRDFVRAVGARRDGGPDPVRAIPPTTDPRPPLSHAQQRLWFLDQLASGDPFYNLPAVVRLTGPLDVRALEQSVRDVVDRHEPLRTRFRVGADGEPYQDILPSVRIELGVVELTGVRDDLRDATLRRLARDEVQRGFDLARGPVLRAALVRLRPNEHVLLLVFHHIAFDGWSTDIFVRELVDGYEAHRVGVARPVSRPPIRYADFAAWHRAWLDSPRARTQLDYWRTRLAGAPSPVTLPTDRPRPGVQTWRGGAVTAELDAELTHGLRALARAEGCSLFMVHLAAFAVLLHAVSGQADLLVGSASANRSRAELEELVGFFVNLLVLRIDVSGGPSFRELLARVRGVTLDAHAHQDIPFDQLVGDIESDRSLARNSLVSVSFGLRNEAAPRRQLPGIRVEDIPVQLERTRYDLRLEVIEAHDATRLTLVYARDLFEEATVAGYLDAHRALVALAVADPRRPVSELADAVRAYRPERRRTRPDVPGPRPGMRRAVAPDRGIATSPDPSGLGVLVESPGGEGAAEWIERHHAEVSRLLLAHGAARLRGFGGRPEDLERVVTTLWGAPMEYVHRSSPRTRVSGLTFTSTEYPAEYRIPLHSEMAYTDTWPAGLCFLCVAAAERGGGTVLADNRAVLARLSPALRARFATGLLYRRAYSPGLDLPWQEVFQTREREAVEAHCRRHAIAFEWTADGGLRTSQIVPAERVHPRTGADLWFNQAHLFHPSALAPEDRELLLRERGAAALPRDVTFADGREIPAADLAEIRAAFDAEGRCAPWVAGDLLLVDNMRVSHGRESFSGHRRVLLAMGTAWADAGPGGA